MKLTRLASHVLLVLGVASILVAGWTFMPCSPPPPEDPSAAARLLDRLQRECKPSLLSNNYDGTTKAQPTEQARDKLLAALREIGAPALAAANARLKAGPDDEFGEMLVLVAAMLGDQARAEEAARLMVWSGYPAVRLCIARELKKLRDPRTAEWFQSALQDDRFVLNDECMRGPPERYYPVRVVAELALRDLGQMPDAGR